MATKPKRKRRKKGRRGGSRPGAGRKPARGEARPSPVTVWLSQADREALGDLAESVREPASLYAHDLLHEAIGKAKRKGRKRCGKGAEDA